MMGGMFAGTEEAPGDYFFQVCLDMGLAHVCRRRLSRALVFVHSVAAVNVRPVMFLISLARWSFHLKPRWSLCSGWCTAQKVPWNGVH